jgi:NUMOD1 domain
LAKARIWTVEHKAKRLEQLKIYLSSAEHKKQLKRLHSSEEHKEHLRRLALSFKGRARPEGAGVSSIQIEVFDTLNNETTVYTSLSEAARTIGCVEGTLRKALKVFKENPGGPSGVTRLIKKRYSIKPLDDKS